MLARSGAAFAVVSHRVERVHADRSFDGHPGHGQFQASHLIDRPRQQSIDRRAKRVVIDREGEPRHAFWQRKVRRILLVLVPRPGHQQREATRGDFGDQVA